MPTMTLIVVCGSWLLLAALSILAYRFNRDRSDD
jgi:hypothetical protein